MSICRAGLLIPGSKPTRGPLNHNKLYSILLSTCQQTIEAYVRMGWTIAAYMQKLATPGGPIFIQMSIVAKQASLLFSSMFNLKFNVAFRITSIYLQWKRASIFVHLAAGDRIQILLSWRWIASPPFWRDLCRVCSTFLYVLSMISLIIEGNIADTKITIFTPLLSNMCWIMPIIHRRHGATLGCTSGHSSS